MGPGSQRDLFDVAIAGAGLAGATAAYLLGQQGVRVVLIDPWATFPAHFKAEKLEPDQIAIVRKFGLLEALSPTAHIREVWSAQHGRIFRREPIEQVGVLYPNLVNSVRAVMPPRVRVKVDRVRDIEAGEDVQRITLASGGRCAARLVAIGCGSSADLPAKLGMRTVTVKENQSLSFGFDVRRSDGTRFSFDAMTYYPDGSSTRTMFLSLFRVADRMRANLFTCWAAGEPRTRAFVREPLRVLEEIHPQLTQLIGRFEVASRVEVGQTDLVRVEGYVQPGVVVLGDAFQSACPATGMGVSKVLTDVDVLCHECVPEWLSSPSMSAAKIGAFYWNRRKVDLDRRALAGAAASRQLATSRALPWRTRRAARRWRLAG